MQQHRPLPSSTIVVVPLQATGRLLAHQLAMEPMKKKAKQTPPSLPSPTADSSGGGSGVDRLSALDDDLCELILRLARLDVRELVRTSVLSKRWRGLWKRSPVLDFFGWPELESTDDVRRYIAVVNGVLEQRAGETSEARIDELKIPLLFGAIRIRRKQQLCTPAVRAAAMKAAEVWIRYAVHHQVRAFQFKLLRPGHVKEVPVMDLDELPSSPKLECLCLGLGAREVRLPRTAVFTSLKDLTLESMELAAGSGPLLARLLSSVCCPSLQKLCMRSVFFDAGTNELVLDAGELLELSIEDAGDMELLELRTPKLLNFKINNCEELESLRISALALKDLTYFSNTAFVQGRLPCVQRLNIDLFTHMEEGDDDQEDPNRSKICLLKLCSSSVRCLLVHLYILPEEERQIDLITDKIPQLPNVTSLSVSIGVLCGRHSFGAGVSGLLTRFKNLEYLSLMLDDSPNIGLKKDEYYSYYSEDAFSCNHPDHWELSDIYFSKLRKADFRGMTATGCELRFLQFVLASATDLQSVTVSFNLCFIKEEEVQDSRMHYFLHSLLGDGTWTAFEDEDLDNKPYKCSKLYKWKPSP